MAKKGVWITWEVQRRNKGISSALEWPLYEISYDGNRIIRYIKSLFMTFMILLKERAEVVVVQNPSILLAIFAILMKYFFRYKCIIDAHNAGIFPREGRSSLLNAVSRLIQRRADYTIVTNESLALTVNKNNGRVIVVPDRLPEPPYDVEFPILTGKVNFAFICTYSSDEPYDEVVKAARKLPKDIVIHFTGKNAGKINPNNIPENVKLLGFLPERNYWGLLSSVDCIIVLTLREHCLVCGAYEAVSLGKPMILSKTTAIKNYFSLGSIYTEPNAESIRQAVLDFIDQRDSLVKELIVLENKLKKGWENSFSELVEQINL